MILTRQINEFDINVPIFDPKLWLLATLCPFFLVYRIFSPACQLQPSAILHL